MSEPPPHDSRPRWGEVGIHGVHRFREWDAVVTVERAGIEGEELDFVALADGRALPGEAAALAEAVGHEPPYRARAVRRGPDLWVVGLTRIRVERRLEPGDSFERLEGDTVVRGVRLADDVWEIETAQL